jgi:HAD superfamily hydrolase (TIGR01509 family)
MKLYGLIFDVDGLIADTEPLNAGVTIKVLEEMFGLKGANPDDFAEGIGKGAEKYIKIASDVHDLRLTDEQITATVRLREQYLIEELQKESPPVFPGVLEIMEAALQKTNFRLAIATSASYELSHAILESVKVPYEKMVYVTGSEITRKKPDPEIFLTAARLMGILPANCVVLEDAPSGVQAAKAAEARCIAVTNTTTAENLSGADLICNSLEQVNLDIIRKLID